jgi:hypothetical protein
MQDDVRAILERAAREHRPVAVYTNQGDPTKFSVGYVDRLSRTQVRLRSLSPDGDDDGYEIRDLSGIHKVELDGRYERKVAFLNASRGEIFREIELATGPANGDLVVSTLREAKAKQLPVVLWTADEAQGVGGFVHGLTRSAVTLQSINDFGEEDGLVTLSLHAIADMDCNSRAGQKLTFLYRKWKGSGRG